MHWTSQGVTPLLVLAVCAAGYGAFAGSLLPRAVYRLAVPPGTPWREHCAAGHDLTGPARGWLGRTCPRCVPAAGPSRRVYAALGAVVCAGLAAFVGPRPELAVWLLTVPVVLLLAAVDSRAQRLPDIVTLPLACTTLVLLGLAALTPGAGGSWTEALLGGTVLTGGYFILFLVNPRGMGFGDVKLAVPLGLALGWYGWSVLFAASFLSFLLAAAYGVALMLAKRAGWKTAVPFGPFMILGTLAGVLLGGITAS